MAYVLQTDLKGLIPDEYLTSALDDDASGVADSGVWDSIVSSVASDIDARLAPGYRTPLAEPLPDLVKAAAKFLALYFAYKRRQIADDQNPWAAEAKSYRERLDRVGRGEEALTYNDQRASSQATLITEPAKTTAGDGSMMV